MNKRIVAAASLTAALSVGGFAPAHAGTMTKPGRPSMNPPITSADVRHLEGGETRRHVQHHIFHMVPGHRVARYTDDVGVHHIWKVYPATHGRRIEVEYDGGPVDGGGYIVVVNSFNWCGEGGRADVPACSSGSAAASRPHGVSTADIAAVQAGQTRWFVQHRDFHRVPGHRIAKYVGKAGVLHRWRAYPATRGREVEVEYVTSATMKTYGQLATVVYICGHAPDGVPSC